MLIINRKNTMVNRNNEFVFVKNHFNEGRVLNEELNYDLITFVLTKTEEEISIDTLAEKSCYDIKELKKAIKYLYEFGSLFIYKSSLEKYNLSNELLELILVYSQPKSNIIKNIEQILDSKIIIPDELLKYFPDIEYYVSYFGLSPIVSIDKKSEQISILADGFEHTLFFSIKETSFKLSKYSDTLHLPKVIEVNSTIKKFGPIYLITYLVKYLLNTAREELIVNREGQYEEVDRNKTFNYFVSDIALFPSYHDAEAFKINEAIKNAEQMIQCDYLNLKLPDLLEGEFSDLEQLGMVVYALYDYQNKKYLAYSGKNYGETVCSSYKRVLPKYVNDNIGESWLVTYPKDYLVDKSLFIANKIDEEGAVYKLEKSGNTFKKFLKNKYDNVNFFVEYFKESNTYILYLYDVETHYIYTFGTKETNICEALEELIFNYMLEISSNETIKTTLEIYKSKDLEFITSSTSIFNNNDDIVVKDKDIIRNVKTLMAHNNIGYSELKWGYEKSENPNDLILRKIEVGKFD